MGQLCQLRVVGNNDGNLPVRPVVLSGTSLIKEPDQSEVVEFLRRITPALSEVLKSHQNATANWQKKAANCENPFETSLCCGDHCRALGILLSVAGYPVSIVTISWLKNGCVWRSQS